MTKSSAHLQFIIDRLITVHHENPATDYMIRLKAIQAEVQTMERISALIQTLTII